MGEARSYPSFMGICSCPNGRLMVVVELCKLGMVLRIDVSMLMKVIDGLLRPINTIFMRIMVLAMETSERTGDRPCTPFTVDMANDVVVRPLKSGVVAISMSTTHVYVFGCKDTMAMSRIAHGVNFVPMSVWISVIWMEMHGPMFVRCARL
jgi:hypothetical protein